MYLCNYVGSYSRSLRGPYTGLEDGSTCSYALSAGYTCIPAQSDNATIKNKNKV